MKLSEIKNLLDQQGIQLSHEEISEVLNSAGDTPAALSKTAILHPAYLEKFSQKTGTLTAPSAGGLSQASVPSNAPVAASVPSSGGCRNPFDALLNPLLVAEVQAASQRVLAVQDVIAELRLREIRTYLELRNLPTEGTLEECEARLHDYASNSEKRLADQQKELDDWKAKLFSSVNW